MIFSFIMGHNNSYFSLVWYSYIAILFLLNVI